MTKLFSSSKHKPDCTTGVVDPLSGAEDSWTDSDYCHITVEDLPIPLDDPVTATPASSLLTLAVRTPGPERSVFTHLKNMSRISVSLKRPKSIRLKGVKERIRLPLIGRRSETNSILDEFPKPPSHIPTPVTPITPAAYRWPSSGAPSIEREQSYCTEEAEVEREKEKSSPFKSLTRVFTTRRGRSSSTRELEAVPEVENSTVIVRPPRPNRSAPPPPSEERKTYQVVDPVNLTAFSTPLLESGLSISARNSFIPPSPSWLSRNVQADSQEKELRAAPTTAAIDGIPDSPPPLPIPPRILISDCSDTPLLSPLSPLEAGASWLEYPEVTNMRHSFVSMINAPKSESDPEYKPEILLLKPSSPSTPSVPTPTAGVRSPLATPTSPTPSYLRFVSQSESDSSELFDSPDSKPTLVSDSPPQRHFFIPSLRPTDPDLPR
ncbi:hypothetical protein GYMLUDRAFT_32876 [Collybiopsis luxurians FD-317 M1]|nr:hypothetical protein GYMLUDRAFT_32876 [Collybiopsis luxurians FD-317 M1]